MTKIEVINIKDAPTGWLDNSDYVYIGRAGKGLDGYFGNPFTLSNGQKRGDTLDRYRAYLSDRIAEDPEFRRRCKKLKGKTLVCFCKPNRCHGDILAYYAASL